MARRKKGRPVSGILLFDKPVGLSSNAALQKVKRLYDAAKAGHTGNLDPLASGMLPICLGQATKISAFLLDADKIYTVRIHFGVRTSTGDAEGEGIETGPTDEQTLSRLAEVLPHFEGEISQIPPMYSAVKHQGKRLYELARKGVEVDRAPRQVTIHQLDLVEQSGVEADLTVRCSKGTYVRTLAEDIAKAMGTCGHVVALRRLAVGPYCDEALHTLSELENLAQEGIEALDGLLLPLDSALQQWPAVSLTMEGAFSLSRGNPVLVPKAPDQGWVRVYGPQSEFLGMGEMLIDGRVAPRRLMSNKKA